jgi:hypothetical protein
VDRFPKSLLLFLLFCEGVLAGEGVFAFFLTTNVSIFNCLPLLFFATTFFRVDLTFFLAGSDDFFTSADGLSSSFSSAFFFFLQAGNPVLFGLRRPFFLQTISQCRQKLGKN